LTQREQFAIRWQANWSVASQPETEALGEVMIIILPVLIS